MARTVAERHIENGRLLATEVRVGDGLMLGPHTFRVATVEPLHIFEWMPQRPPGVSVNQATAEYDQSSAGGFPYGPHVIKFAGHIEDIDQPRNLIAATDHVFQLEEADRG